MGKALFTFMLVVSLLNSSEIKQGETVNSKVSQSRSIAPNTSRCTHFNAERVQQLNIRDKLGKPSNIVGKLNYEKSICIYEFKGKWGRSDRGWLSMKYLQ